MLMSRREKEVVDVSRMNSVGVLSLRGEVSVGQLKVLMGIVQEQNHSHRWLTRLYLEAKNEWKRTQL